MLALAAGAALSAAARGEAAPGPATAAAETRDQNAADLREVAQIRIENAPGGAVAVRDGGVWRQVGAVLRHAEKVDARGFGASRWAPDGAVAATAVNAIHIKVAHNQAEDRGIVFSILPREFAPGAGQPFAEASAPGASIYTDLPAGSAIFGGDFSPLVGNPVFLESEGVLARLPGDYVPRRADVLVISVRRPERYPSQVVLENRFGGIIYLEYPDGLGRPIGQVLRPVIGVGRFPGTLYAGIGRIRANHPGVIDISTSLPGEVGGFQIIPAAHAMSPETKYVRRLTQWMVVGPLCALEPSWEGVAPLFLQYLRPKYSAADLYAEDWQERLLGRFLVEVRIGGRWQAMPHLGLGTSPDAPLPEWAMTALEPVEAIRIMFPLE